MLEQLDAGSRRLTDDVVVRLRLPPIGHIQGAVSFLVDQNGDRRYDLITSAYFDGESAEIYRKADEVATGSPVP